MTALSFGKRFFDWKQFQKAWKDFDGMLLATVIALNGLGVLAIYSTRTADSFWTQQAIMGGLCLIVSIVIARIDYQVWLKWHWVVYAGAMGMLLAVLFVGVTGGGADRWIIVAGFKVQPSEFAKLSVILTAAAVMHRWPIKYFSQIWVVALAIAPPWLLIFLQPDLGTALIFIAISVGMLYWGGARASWLLLLASPVAGAIMYGIYANTEAKWMLWAWLAWAVAMCVLAAWQLPWRRIGAFSFGVINLLAGVLGQIAWGILKPYQQQRLIIFMDPNQDPLGAGYHLIQSRIAIGAGGLWGRGITQGTQTQLDFIPEQHTDFIFAAIGEELGFVGAMVTIAMIWMICFRLIVIAQNAKDNFGSLVAIGVFSMILFQSIVNIGMTIGLMPITGLPLPFVSYGRSALLTNFLALGIVESIAKHRQRNTFFI